MIKFCYFLINSIELPTDQQAVKQEFEKFCAYCLRFSEYLPIVFIIGFFVSTIVSRWWDQFCSLPNPEQIAMKVVNFLPAKVIQISYKDLNKNSLYILKEIDFKSQLTLHSVFLFENQSIFE